MPNSRLRKVREGMKIYNESVQDYFSSGNGTVSLRNNFNLRAMGGLETLGYALATVLHPIKSYRAFRGTKFNSASMLEEWWE